MPMNDSTMKEDTPSISREQAIAVLNARLGAELPFEIYPEELMYCSWPEAFGTTCGPFPGVGGQMVTTFRMEAWAYGHLAVVFCGGRVVSCGEFSIGASYRKR